MPILLAARESSRSSTDICSAPPLPSPFQASCLSWAKDKDSMGKQELQAWGSGHGIIVTGTGMRAGWGVTRGRHPGPDCR